MADKPLQVIRNENHSFELDENLLRSVLMRDELKGRYLCVVSIAGAYRKGKSFLLNFFLRYLESKYVQLDATKWLADEKQPLRGFSWRSGPDGDTSGILMWSKVYLHDYPNGEKVAIILLDTQGSFDDCHTKHESVTAFALSIMLSSVQIFNISQNLQGDDLENLYLFAEYGRMLSNCDSKTPFQKLQFLVRDWQWPNKYEYGAEGGAELLRQRFNLTAALAEEQQTLRKNIIACFKEIDCFLMPYPGVKVRSDIEFEGCLEDVDSLFKQYLNELVTQIFAPENLIFKTINGERICADIFMQLFKSSVEMFKSDALPKAENIMSVTMELFIAKIAKNIKEKFNDELQTICQADFVPIDFLNDEFNRLQTLLTLEFNEQIPSGFDELKAKYKEILESDFVQVSTIYKNENSSKLSQAVNVLIKTHSDSIAMYKQSMQNVSLSELESSHNNFKQLAVDKFDSINCFGCNDVKEKHIGTLFQEIDVIYKVIKQELEQKAAKEQMETIEGFIKDAVRKARAALKEACRPHWIPDDSLLEEYDTRKQEILYKLNKMIPKELNNQKVEYRNNLEAELEDILEACQRENDFKYGIAEKTMIRKRTELKNEYKHAMQDVTELDKLDEFDRLKKEDCLRKFNDMLSLDCEPAYNEHIDKLEYDIDGLYLSHKQQLTNTKTEKAEIQTFQKAEEENKQFEKIIDAFIATADEKIKSTMSSKYGTAYVAVGNLITDFQQQKMQLLNELTTLISKEYTNTNKVEYEILNMKYASKLNEKLEQTFTTYKMENDLKLEGVKRHLWQSVHDLVKDYERSMMNFSPRDRIANHDMKKSYILKEFDALPFTVCDSLKMEYREKLINDIEYHYDIYNQPKADEEDEGVPGEETVKIAASAAWTASEKGKTAQHIWSKLDWKRTKSLLNLKRDALKSLVEAVTCHAIQDIPTPTSENSMIATFANDTVIMVSNRNAKDAATLLQNELNKTLDWFKTWGVEINGDKTVQRSVKFIRRYVSINDTHFSLVVKLWAPLFGKPLQGNIFFTHF